MSIYSYGRANSQKECASEHSSLIGGLLKIQQVPGWAYYRGLSICQFNQYNNKYRDGCAVYSPFYGFNLPCSPGCVSIKESLAGGEGGWEEKENQVHVVFLKADCSCWILHRRWLSKWSAFGLFGLAASFDCVLMWPRIVQSYLIFAKMFSGTSNCKKKSGIKMCKL